MLIMTVKKLKCKMCVYRTWKLYIILTISPGTHKHTHTASCVTHTQIPTPLWFLSWRFLNICDPCVTFVLPGHQAERSWCWCCLTPHQAALALSWIHVLYIYTSVWQIFSHIRHNEWLPGDSLFSQQLGSKTKGQGNTVRSLTCFHLGDFNALRLQVLTKCSLFNPN